MEQQLRTGRTDGDHSTAAENRQSGGARIQELWYQAVAQNKADFTPNEDAWAGSRYAYLRTLQSRRRGAAGEALVENLLRSLGYQVARTKDTHADRKVTGTGGETRIEIKFSTEWEGGWYRWSQFRDQDYDWVVLVGISPHAARIWVIPKDVVLAHAEGQHSGADATETFWMAVDVNNIPEWMNEWGGDLHCVPQAFRQAFGSPLTAEDAAGDGKPTFADAAKLCR